MAEILLKISKPSGVFLEVSRQELKGFNIDYRQFLLNKFSLQTFGKYKHLVHTISYIKKGANVDEINDALDETFGFAASAVKQTDLFLLSHFLGWQLFDLYNVRLIMHGSEIMSKFEEVKDLTLAQASIFNRFGYNSEPSHAQKEIAISDRDALTRFVYHIAPDLLKMLEYEFIAVNSDKSLQKFASHADRRTYLQGVIDTILRMDNSFATKVLIDRIQNFVDRATESSHPADQITSGPNRTLRKEKM